MLLSQTKAPMWASYLFPIDDQNTLASSTLYFDDYLPSKDGGAKAPWYAVRMEGLDIYAKTFMRDLIGEKWKDRRHYLDRLMTTAIAKAAHVKGYDPMTWVEPKVLWRDFNIVNNPHDKTVHMFITFDFFEDGIFPHPNGKFAGDVLLEIFPIGTHFRINKVIVLPPHHCGDEKLIEWDIANTSDVMLPLSEKPKYSSPLCKMEDRYGCTGHAYLGYMSYTHKQCYDGMKKDFVPASFRHDVEFIGLYLAKLIDPFKDTDCVVPTVKDFTLVCNFDHIKQEVTYDFYFEVEDVNGSNGVIKLTRMMNYQEAANIANKELWKTIPCKWQLSGFVQPQMIDPNTAHLASNFDFKKFPQPNFNNQNMPKGNVPCIGTSFQSAVIQDAAAVQLDFNEMEKKMLGLVADKLGLGGVTIDATEWGDLNLQFEKSGTSEAIEKFHEVIHAIQENKGILHKTGAEPVGESQLQTAMKSLGLDMSNVATEMQQFQQMLKDGLSPKDISVIATKKSESGEMPQPKSQKHIKAGVSLSEAVANAKKGMAEQAASKTGKLQHNPSASALGAFFKGKVKQYFGKTVTLNPKAFGQLKQLITRVGKNRVYRTMQTVMDNWDEFLAYVKEERNWEPDCKVPNMGILLYLADEMQEFYAMKSGDKDVDEGKTAYQTKDEVAQSNKSAIDNIWK